MKYRRRKIGFIAAMMLGIMLFCGAECLAETSPAVLYVSPQGSDANGGTSNAPFGTINRALEAAKNLDQKNGVKILLKGGTYYLDDTVEINRSFQSSKSNPISIESAEGEKAVISMGVKLDPKKFSLVKDETTLNRIPENARGEVYACNLREFGIAEYGSIERVERHQIVTPVSTMLIADDKMMTVAEWPNRAFTSVKEVYAATGGYKFSIAEDRVKNWQTAEKIYAYGNFYEDWADETFLLKNMNVSERSFETTYNTVHGVKAGGQVRFINLLEELDIPGEFYVNTTDGMLYYYPTGKLSDTDLYIVLSKKTMFNITDTSHISFKNITFEGTRGCAFNLTNADNNSFTGCEFRNIGQQVFLINEGKNNLIDGNYMHDIGKGCVRITGGDRKTLIHSNNVISNNEMERFSVIGKRYCEAVSLSGVGDVLAHNRIHNSPHHAIQFNGVENTIEYNDIYHCLAETGDAGAIYAGRSWTNLGNNIRYNYIHDCRQEGAGRAAIYCDDFMTGVNIYGNRIVNMNRGVSVHSSQFLNIRNNFFGNIRYRAVYVNNIDEQSDEYIRKQNALASSLYEDGTIRERYNQLYEKLHGNFSSYYKNYNPDEPAWQKYEFAKRYTTDNYVVSPRGNVVTDNVLYNAEIVVNSELALESGVYKDNVTLKENPLDENCGGNSKFKNESEIAGYFDDTLFDDFKFPTMDEIGVIGVKTDTLESFEITAPKNGAKNIDARDVSLCWEDISGADRYRLVVAKDAEFKDIVCDETVYGTYKWFRNLKYNETTYYWKVQGLSSEYLYGSGNTIWNSNGVYSFTTAKYETVDKSEINERLEEARRYLETAAEGDKAGEQRIGSIDRFRTEIDAVEKIAKNDGVSSKSLGRALDRLSEARVKFDSEKNAETINIKSMIADAENWDGITRFMGDKLMFDKDGWGGYTGDELKIHNKVKFKAVYNLTDDGYTSVGVRAASTAIEPWNTKEYIFLIKKNVIELQKFNGSKRFFEEVPNTFISSGTTHEIEFGAISEGDNVRITLTVDGKSVYDYIDKEYTVSMPGYFHVYNHGGSTVEISAAD